MKTKRTRTFSIVYNDQIANRGPKPHVYTRPCIPSVALQALNYYWLVLKRHWAWTYSKRPYRLLIWTYGGRNATCVWLQGLMNIKNYCMYKILVSISSMWAHSCRGGRWLMGTWAVARWISWALTFWWRKPHQNKSWTRFFCDLKHESIFLSVSKKYYR